MREDWEAQERSKFKGPIWVKPVRKETGQTRGPEKERGIWTEQACQQGEQEGTKTRKFKRLTFLRNGNGPETAPGFRCGKSFYSRGRRDYVPYG